MSEADSRESARSRWITRISISLAVIAALVVVIFIDATDTSTSP